MRRASAASVRKGSGLVDAPGRWLVGAKGEYPLRAPRRGNLNGRSRRWISHLPPPRRISPGRQPWRGQRRRPWRGQRPPCRGGARAAPPTTRDHCKRSRRRRSHLPRRAPSVASQWATLQCCPPGPAQRRSRRTAPGLRPPRGMMAVSVWGPPIACGSGRDSIQSASSFPSPRALARRNRGLPIVDARLSTRTPPRARRSASRSGGGSTASCVVVWVFVVIVGGGPSAKNGPLAEHDECTASFLKSAALMRSGGSALGFACNVARPFARGRPRADGVFVPRLLRGPPASGEEGLHGASEREEPITDRVPARLRRFLDHAAYLRPRLARRGNERREREHSGQDDRPPDAFHGSLLCSRDDASVTPGRTITSFLVVVPVTLVVPIAVPAVLVPAQVLARVPPVRSAVVGRAIVRRSHHHGRRRYHHGRAREESETRKAEEDRDAGRRGMRRGQRQEAQEHDRQDRLLHGNTSVSECNNGGRSALRCKGAGPYQGSDGRAAMALDRTAQPTAQL